MALKKRNNNKDDGFVTGKEATDTAEPIEETEGPTPEKNPEAPKERQGDGIASGEVPAGFYKNRE